MYESRAFAGLKHTPSLGSMDVSSTSTESARITVPNGLTVALLQNNGLTQTLGTGEAWVPVGFFYTIGTTVAVAAPVLSLANGGTAITGATASIPTASNGTTYLYAALASYTLPTITAGMTWSLKVTTTNSATGAITPYLSYVPIAYAAVSDALTTI